MLKREIVNAGDFSQVVEQFCEGITSARFELHLGQRIGDEIQAVLRRLDWIWVNVKNGCLQLAVADSFSM